MNVEQHEPAALLPLGSPQLSLVANSDRVRSEMDLVNRLRSSRSTDNHPADPGSLIYLYVSLKSRPIALLFGQPGSGKQAAADRHVSLLAGPDKLCDQHMSGHAWWASGSRNAGTLAEAQRRFNIDKFDAMVSEALRPEKCRNVYVACMRQISPAEWMGLLAPLAFQWRKGHIIRIDSLHFPRPKPFPDNLLGLATMDRVRVPLPSPACLAGLSLLHWPPTRTTSGPPDPGASPPVEFHTPAHDPAPLQGRITSRKAAMRRLAQTRGSHRQALDGLVSILGALPWLPGPLREVLEANALIDLANSLSENGRGLFHPDPQSNSLLALDMIISQSLLPTAFLSRSNQVPNLERVAAVLDPRLPRSRRYLSTRFSPRDAAIRCG